MEESPESEILEDNSGKSSEEIALLREEFDLRRYEAKLGLRKVVYGTMIVGLAGVLVPAAIEGWSLVFQKWQNEAQRAFDEQSRQESFLQTHFETAIDENLELRLRFAEYYAYSVDSYAGADDDNKGNWGRYYEELKRQRGDLREDILGKEREARGILSRPSEERTPTEDLKLAELEIHLDWLYDEIEYTEPGREVKPKSSVLSAASAVITPGTVLHYKSILGPGAYGPDTSKLQPNQDLAIAVLGSPGPEIERCLTLIELPYTMMIDFNRRQSTNKVRVHRAVAENFEKAFRTIGDSELDRDRELGYAGTYAHRKLRGSSRWSNHAFGIEIDFNAETNGLRAGQDRMTMHPIIVNAFKDAGFAWRGDLNFDGMSFTISAETLNKIADSGFSPADCAGD